MSLLLLPKTAAARSYDMTGRLYLSSNGWALLSVPNAIVHGVFDTLGEPGAELPPGNDDGRFNAHISVMRPEEIEEYLTEPGKLTERGHSFRYSLGHLKSFVPAGWPEMSKCWAIEVKSPELEKLRKSYGMPPLPKYPFHATVAVRKKRVLYGNETSKASSSEDGDSGRPRNGGFAGVSKLAGNEREMRQSESYPVQGLRGEGNRSLQKVATIFFGLFPGYGEET